MTIIRNAKVFWNFCRPHTVIGTSLQVLTAYFFASENLPTFLHNLNLLFLTWLSCVAVNIYVVGINQIVDRKVDQINKPFLPLAAGEISQSTAWAISLSMGLIALVSSYSLSLWLFTTLCAVLAIGTIYSIPHIYLKGTPLGAILAISFARGLISNVGVFLHFHTILFANSSIPSSIIAFALFNFCFGVVIALMKDAPDLIGDKLYGIKTLSVRIGIKSVFKLSMNILTVAYLALTVIVAVNLSTLSVLMMIVLHGIILGYAWFRATHLDFENKKSIYTYYMLLWKFFYLEFGIFSLAYSMR